MKEIIGSSEVDEFSEDAVEVVGRLEKKIAILKRRLERRRKEIQELEEENYSLRKKIGVEDEEIELGSEESICGSEDSSEVSEDSDDFLVAGEDSSGDLVSSGSGNVVERDKEDCVVFDGPAGNGDDGGSEEVVSDEAIRNASMNGEDELNVDSGNGDLEDDDMIIID